MTEEQIALRVSILLFVLVFGGLFIVGALGIFVQQKTSQEYIKAYSSSSQCIEQVKSLKIDSYNCYTNKKCKTVIGRY